MEFNYKKPDNKENLLEQFGRDITNDAKNNKIDPIIGRDLEIRRLIEIISRKSKNNPVLIGEPGVGKTAIVEGFAQRIINKDVPTNLLNKKIIELSLSSLISGASYQGQFEERLNGVIKQVKESNGNIILFIDEIHQLVGTGKNSGGSMDAANILKPMMARGEVKIIGATTLNEYREYIEKDSALERRMQKIIISEPSKEEALTIMRGLKQRWELFHQVKIHDSALVSAVNLSDRYITDRFLPDKAIDLVDEAAAKIKTQLHSLPVELDELNRKIIHLETARAALSNEKDEKSKIQLKTTEELLEKIKKEQLEKNNIWTSQKNKHDKIIKLKTELNNFKNSIEKLQLNGEYEKASKILYVNIPSLEKEIISLEKEIQSDEKQQMFSDEVKSSDIAEVVSKTTLIPLNKLIQSEKDKLLDLEKELKQIVKGQDSAIELVSNAILRSKVGINDPSRPIGSFLFAGPTGVGKTELAKAISLSLFNSINNIVRFDMSEYMEKHSVSKLIGSPPGYIGYEQGGILTEKIRRNPYSVILFDEIEKAHLDVLNILLQILDDGQLKDSHGRFINFKNTIIILTSNVGSQFILENKNNEFLLELKKIFKPEFLNRIDEIICFNKLSKSILIEIVKNEIKKLQLRLESEEYFISFDDNVYSNIIDNSYNEAYGARPIKRYIQKNIEDLIAKSIIKNTIVKNKKYKITLKNNIFIIE